ncbi:hypothetical protein [Marisediminicola antarctica]|uniref:Uncharacterized protein n=1 Tax=Marisediminicola antarctica TaxID=674079 RepID=A0A7L5AEY1_9MICO|nr:hypothetical protein [Marisediminicola antarctica]QHO68980.1 hypothetical protein BHD05_04315 [Marisediminicola antarctica]
MTDRRGETTRFDPRFDPAFQPGYDTAATLQGERVDGGAPRRGIADAPDATVSDRRSADQRSADQRSADQHAADQHGADLPTTERRATDRATTERRATDRATIERRATDRATAEQPATNRATTDRATTDRATTDQRAAGSQSGLAPNGSGPRPHGPPLPYAEAETGSGAPGRFGVEESDVAPPTHSVNPFLLVLWVASALMVFGGVALFQWVGQLTAEAQRTGSAPYDYFLVQSLIFGAPLLMVLGVATATGILFVHAVRWRKRR